MKPMSRNVIIEDADEISRTAIKKILEKQGFGDHLSVQAPGHKQDGPVIRLLEGKAAGPNDFTKPVRAGAVLVLSRKLMASGKVTEMVSFGRYNLNMISHELNHADGAVIRLTEKESHILRLLAVKPGVVVNRKALLEQVWQYGEGIETHTLETHIYRLRQKIEADPAKPSLLLTDTEGYKLSN
jgi:DNA-binding response OmpR family regulator